LVPVKTLKAAPWGTQTAIAVVPVLYILGKDGTKKMKTGLTIATMRVLSKVIRYYRCHEIGHMANKCSTSPGKERCKKCGALGYTIAKFGNAPKCALCSKRSEVRTGHVMGWLAFPTYRKLMHKGAASGGVY
jgi:hypothetical protein